MRKLPKRFTLPAGIKALRVERNDAQECWMIWLNANSDFSLGSFIELYDKGNITRVIWHEDGAESVFHITNEEMEM